MRIHLCCLKLPNETLEKQFSCYEIVLILYINTGGGGGGSVSLVISNDCLKRLKYIVGLTLKATACTKTVN